MAVEKREIITCFALTSSERKDLDRACSNTDTRMSDYIRNIVMKQVKKDNK